MVQRWPAVPMAAKADGAQSQIEVGGGAQDTGVVAAELEKGDGRSAAAIFGADGAAHAGGTRGGDERNEVESRRGASPRPCRRR